MAEKTDLQKVADKLEEQSRKETQEAIRRIQERNRKENMEKYGCVCPAAKCYRSCPRYLTHSKHEDLFYWLDKTRPPDRREREAILPIPGAVARGKGNGNRRRRSKKNLNAQPASYDRYR